MKPAGQGATDPFPEFLQRTLIHEDYISFAEGLNTKVSRVVGAASRIIHTVFTMFGGFDLNKAALVQLKNNSRAYSFEYFADTGASVAG